MNRYLDSALERNILKWAPERGDPRRDAFFKSLSSHHQLNTETLKRYRDENWCMFYLAANKNFSWEWVTDIFPTKRWNWRSLSYKSPSMDVILSNLDKEWDWTVLTVEPGVTFSDMVQWNNLPWRINQVLFVDLESDTDLEFLRMYREHYDDIAWVDHSRRAVWSLVKRSPDLPWRWHVVKIEVNDESDVRFLVEEVPDQTSVNWSTLSATVDAGLILRTRHIGFWNWSVVSLNKTLTYDQVLAHPEIPWNYSMVPCEKFNDGLARRWMAAFKIQTQWRLAVSCPAFDLCRRRLIREWETYDLS